MPGAVAMLKLLAVTDPVQAQAVLDAIHLGLALSGTSAADGTISSALAAAITLITRARSG
jgi:hypothetical protein